MFEKAGSGFYRVLTEFFFLGNNGTTQNKMASDYGNRFELDSHRMTFADSPNSPTRSVRALFSEFYWVLPGFTGFYWVLLGFTGFYRILPSFTEFYRVLLGFTGFYRVLTSFTGFYRVLPSFTEFYRVLLGFAGFNWVFLDLL